MAVGSLSRMALFLRKLLRIGTLPADMRAAVDEEGVIFLAEFVAVTIRFSGAVPGKSSATNVSSNAGALALTNQRVLGTLASVPKQAGRAVDHAWNSDNGSMVTATLDGAHTAVAHDSYFLKGRAGLWTKSDSVTDFDDVTFTPNVK